MAINHSNGKARPTLTRSSNLLAHPGEPPATKAGHKRIVRKWLAFSVEDEELNELATDARRLGTFLLEDLPYEGPQVSPLVAARARSVVLSSYYAKKAAEAGLLTDKGMKLMELSIKLDARAERLAITSYDISTRYAAALRAAQKSDDLAALLESTAEPAPESVKVVDETSCQDTGPSLDNKPA